MTTEFRYVHDYGNWHIALVASNGSLPEGICGATYQKPKGHWASVRHFDGMALDIDERTVCGTCLLIFPKAWPPETMCDCGKPLHYVRAESLASVEQLVAKLGPNIRVESAFGSWMVPRHYIALHGLRTVELPQLAAKYGWEKTT